MLGYTPDELAGNVSTWESLVHPDDWYDIRDSLEPHLRGAVQLDTTLWTPLTPKPGCPECGGLGGLAGRRDVGVA